MFVAACAVPDGGLFRAARFRDVHLYQRYTELLLHGHVPYRDFFMEYPPGALAVFIPPAAATSAHYNAAFKALMALCGCAALVLVAVVLLRLRASRIRMWVAVLLVALSPIALGPISLNTYDGWPAFLTILSVSLVLFGRLRTAGAVLGLAFAAKVYPVVLLPLLLIWSGRTAGKRRAAECAIAFVAVALVVIVPLLVLAPHGLLESFRSQAARGLQVESLGAQVLVAAHHLGWYTVTVAHHTRGAVSYDVRGSLARTLGAVSSALQVAAVVATSWLYARGRDAGTRFVIACANAVAGFLAFSRFFSPQYLVWVVPLVPLVPSATAWILLGAALALDQVWFFHYHSIVSLGSRSWFVLARDAIVVALFFLLLCTHAAKDENAVVLEDELPLRVPA